MKVVIVKENGVVRVLEGKGKIETNSLALRNRFTDLKYYELDYNEGFKMPLESFIVAINQNVNILNKSAMIKEII